MFTVLDGNCTVNIFDSSSSYEVNGCVMSPNYTDSYWPGTRYVDTDSVTCTIQVNHDVNIWTQDFWLGSADYLEITHPGDPYPQRYYGGSISPSSQYLQADTTISFVTNSSDFHTDRGFRLCGYIPTGVALHFQS